MLGQRGFWDIEERLKELDTRNNLARSLIS